jgi:geranylgeranyl pyrophosphate synthase
MSRVSSLLARYDTLAPSVKVIEQYLDRARQALGALPRTPGRAALQQLTQFLARQTETLGVCV